MLCPVKKERGTQFCLHVERSAESIIVRSCDIALAEMLMKSTQGYRVFSKSVLPTFIHIIATTYL